MVVGVFNIKHEFITGVKCKSGYALSCAQCPGGSNGCEGADSDCKWDINVCVNKGKTMRCSYTF